MRGIGKRMGCVCACAGLCMSLWTGCAGNKAESDFKVELPTGPEVSEVYVEAVPGISDDFIRGIDMSSVLVEENSGVVFYNFDGEEQDVFQTLAEAGVNSIRLRVWNDP